MYCEKVLLEICLIYFIIFLTDFLKTINDQEVPTELKIA